MALISIGLHLSRLLGTPPSPAMAFSPYETYLLSGQDTRVGLIARAQPEREAEVRKALLELEMAAEKESFSKAGIRHLASFSRQINSSTWFFVYFEYRGDKLYTRAAEAFEAASPKVTRLSQMLSPAAGETSASRWTQMEWISYIRGKNVPDNPRQKLSLVTTLKPEKELQYRTMHQAIWPGVVDQMVRGNNRNFSAFLCEIERELYEFIYVEYVGSDAEKDKELSQQDPINRRWWKLTDECQKPLPGEDAIWSKMDLISTEE